VLTYDTATNGRAKMSDYQLGYELGRADALRGFADDSNRLKRMGKEFISGYLDGFYSV